jgi:hypothetical protein
VLGARQLRASRHPRRAVSSGFERNIDAHSDKHETRLVERVSAWLLVQGRQDSNLEPPVLETGGFRLESAASGERATVGAAVISGAGRR